MNNSNFFELAVTVSTLSVLEKVDLSSFTAFYLGNPFCSNLKDNLGCCLEDLKKGIYYLKEKGKKIYLVTPVIPLNKDFKNIIQLLEMGRAEEIEGIEVHDMGVLQLVRESPLKIHLSTFANVYNKITALKFQELGVKRVIPSPELTLEEIGELKSIPDLEIELPIQGKLPLGIANACLLSIYPAKGGVNFPSREKLPCEQTCFEENWLEFNGLRLRTKGTATFTGADLSMIEYLPSLLKGGYSHFRIEGLWETPGNLSRLGQIYQQAFEEIPQGRFNPKFKLQEIREIAAEVCNGWYFGHSGKEYVKLIKS